MPQSQTAPLPRYQQEEETDKTKTSENRTNVRKAPRLALSYPSEVIAILKGLKNTRTKGKTIKTKSIFAQLTFRLILISLFQES